MDKLTLLKLSRGVFTLVIPSQIPERLYVLNATVVSYMLVGEVTG
jgi:hypothetical protein